MLAGLPNPFVATRYHSLSIRPDTLPGALEVTGRTDGGVIMAVRHRELPVVGVQFHPESVLTEGGHRLLANWMASAGHPVPEATVEALTAEAAAVTATRLTGRARYRGVATHSDVPRGQVAMPKSKVRKKAAYTPPPNRPAPPR